MDGLLFRPKERIVCFSALKYKAAHLPEQGYAGNGGYGIDFRGIPSIIN